MVDWSNYYSDQGADSLACLVTLRHHNAKVAGSILRLGSFNSVTLCLRYIDFNHFVYFVSDMYTLKNYNMACGGRDYTK